ncbi:TPA: hypothetical protein CPT80_03355 [Candidatus Gastranaerophilales bacterium HUM_9]|nr:MAG TPA: hypothetical protein CPT80_03355 [Candidatus Gastranaerophilales bacterium HUM_9]HBX34905.1 hypothetical protein [Cyanobacteria bacterium UBA11440]
MIQNTPNYPVQQPNVNGQQGTQATHKPSFAPSYNAVQINLDTPTLNAPQPSYYYDYPQASGQPYYPPVQPQPQPQQPQQPVNVPQPQTEQPQQTQGTQQPQAPADVNAPVDANAPAAASDVDINKVLTNLSDPDYDKQAVQMEEIAKKGLTNEADAVPYVQEDVFKKLFDIINVDSTKLAGPTEQQLQLREKVAQNDMAIYNAQQAGKDPSTVELPNKLTADEEKLANTITPLEQAERNKEYALFTTAVLQKTYGDEIEKRSGNVVPLTDLPGAAVVVDELKENQNPAIRLAAIDALRYVQRPEYKNDLAQIYSIAQSDADEGVAAAATDAAKSLEAPQK